MELLFERFLNENRGEWPDIDSPPPKTSANKQYSTSINATMN
jgi:hypothetical protein